jgi:uncharacterized protein YbjQ (UPF0145 family)
MQETNRLEQVNQSLARIAAELGEVEVALRQLDSEAAKDVTAPINRLVQALAAAAEKTVTSSERVEQLRGDIQGMTVASQELGNRLGQNVASPIAAHQVALTKMHDQLAGAVRQMESAAQQMESSAQIKIGNDTKLLAELGELRQTMGETNTQLQALISRIDAESAGEHKSGLWNRLFGGGADTGNP